MANAEKRNTIYIEKRRTMVDALSSNNRIDLESKDDPAIDLLRAITEATGYGTKMHMLYRSSGDTVLEEVKQWPASVILLWNAWVLLLEGGGVKQANDKLNYSDRVELSQLLKWENEVECEIDSSALRGFYLAVNRFSYAALWEVLLSDVDLVNNHAAIKKWFTNDAIGKYMAQFTSAVLEAYRRDSPDCVCDLYRFYSLRFSTGDYIHSKKDIMKGKAQALSITESISRSPGKTGPAVLLDSDITAGKKRLVYMLYRLFDDLLIIDGVHVDHNWSNYADTMIWLESEALAHDIVLGSAVRKENNSECKLIVLRRADARRDANRGGEDDSKKNVSK